jgi:hypothetical protein
VSAVLPAGFKAQSGATSPALGLSTDTGVISFCFIAIGYLAILIAEAWTRRRDGLAGYPLGGRYRIGDALQGLREEAATST